MVIGAIGYPIKNTETVDTSVNDPGNHLRVGNAETVAIAISKFYEAFAKVFVVVGVFKIQGLPLCCYGQNQRS